MANKTNKSRKIPINDAFHFDREGFSGDIYVQTNEGAGYNALIVDVHGRHPKKRMLGATRNYLIIDGTGTFTIDGKQHQVKKGDLFVIPDGGEYEYEGKMTLFEFNVPETTSDNAIPLE